MRVTVDATRCVATGQCVVMAPEVFTQNDDDGTSEPLAGEVGEILRDTARRAAAMCPTRAIQLDEVS
ncbi:ferredoxin [Streptomyces sp. NBC_01590]